jgi:uncharacterized protein YbbC (DUF1343 family)/CubicO group peptidase (beta-lactamase class C family)
MIFGPRNVTSQILSLLPLLVASLTLRATGQAAQSLNPAKLTEIDAAIERCIATNGTPGAVFRLERDGQQYQRAYGNRTLLPTMEPMTEDTIFDAASLTKVIATTPAVLLLIQRGQIELDAPVVRYLPAFQTHAKDLITIHQLLTHTSGLRPDVDLSPAWSGYSAAVELACKEKLAAVPGTVFRYSDINFLVLGEIVRRVSGQSLAEFVAHEIYEPLGMKDSGFNPNAALLPRIAPTEWADGQMLRGTVHDPTARRMGGVAGHAGLFTTASDLARFARMMLDGGELGGVRLFTPETVRLMTEVQTPDLIPARRGLGWDIDSGYSRPRGNLFPLGSYGHTGFTGTCLWIDPFSRTFYIFLSNRVHPDGKGNVLPLEAALGTLAAEAITDFDFAHVTGALAVRAEVPSPAARARAAIIEHAVKNGIDTLVFEDFTPLQGLKLGLITNHTGTDAERNPTIDLLHCAPGVRLQALFSPEHGIRGTLDQRVPDSKDEKTGLPIYSLYGERQAPKPEQLCDLDALVFDLQDIGCRFYTYISTLGHCLEAAAQAKIRFYVLDRVNPIGGQVDGPVLQGEPSFTGFHPIPVRHGMTVGELALMFNQERHFGTDLLVIPVQGWHRNQWFDFTGLPWTNPSPNMRSLTEATLYPGVGLLEMTNLSVGRGTDTPFERVGAPYIDDVAFASELNRLALPGVRFVPIRFTPTASTFKDQPCGGAAIILTDRENCPVLDLGIGIAQTVYRLYPTEFQIDKFNRLLSHEPTLDALKAGKDLPTIRALWKADLEDFERRRAPFLLYR